MKFSYNFLQSFFKKKLPSPEKLADLLMMHFFEVEDIEKKGKDFVLDIDILSSRAGDCLSHMGVAREIAAITGEDFVMPETKIKKYGKDINEKASVEVRGGCLRYTLSGVEGVKVKSSPSYIQARLKSCGIRPINNVVDVTNYVMLETGQPLHAFDAKKIEGEKIIVRYAKKREKIVTLDEKRYDLRDSILVISDELSPIGIAGIKGGIVPEVDKETETIFLEAANFDPITVRKGSQYLKLRTDASLRFEHGIPLELTKIAIDRAVSLISQTAGGQVFKNVVDYYPEKRKEKIIHFNIDDVRSVLGTAISYKEVERVLRALNFKVQREKDLFSVTAPYFRIDVEIKEDIIEEIGRIYGYENISPENPKEDIIPSKENNFHIETNCREIWKGFGFSETYNYSFINEKYAEFFKREELIEMEKPASLEFKFLRPSLIPGLLKNLQENEKNYEEIGLFETGKVFLKKEGEVKEEKKMAVISSTDNFYTIKGKIDSFLKKIFLEDISYTECEKRTFFENFSSAKIIFQNECIGFLGKLSQKVRKEMKIKSNPLIVEFDFSKLKKFYREKVEYKPIFKFPSLIRDIAVLVPKDVSYEDVQKKINKEGGLVLRKIELFDFYEGKGIPQEMKSFAFRLTFQSKNKTLSSQEANNLQEKVIKALEDVSDWKVRR